MIRNIKPKLAEYGKIKIGRLGDERTAKDGKSTYRLPTKLDHFLITTTERDDSGNFIPNVPLMEQIAEMVNEPTDHLTTIPVYLLFDDIDSNFYTTYNCYQGKSRICTGDGEKAVILKTGEEITCPCPRLDQDYKGHTPCKPYGRLNVVLQSMDMIGGAWVYRTTGWNSVQDILGSLMLIKRVAGRLSGIPLMMKLFPKTTQLPRGPVTVYTVSLIYAGSALALAEEAKRCPMIGHDERVPDQVIVAEEEAEIQEEFFPPETETERAEATAGTVTEKIKEPAEKQEPTAAELARADADKLEKKQTEDVTSEKLEKAKAKAAAKKKREDVKKAKEAADAEKKEKDRVMEEQKAGEDTSGEIPPEGEPVIEEGEVLDGPPEDFGWV